MGHPPGLREELEAIVGGYRHLQEEHRRAHAEGRVRHHLGTQLRELELRYERLLEEWVPEEEVRVGWREHLYGDAPAPAQPPMERRLVFRGHAENGSVLEIRERADGDYDVDLDGQLVERLDGREEPLRESLTGVFSLDGKRERPYG